MPACAGRTPWELRATFQLPDRAPLAASVERLRPKCLQAEPNPDQARPRKWAWIVLVSFVRFGAFQCVTGSPNQKCNSRVPSARGRQWASLRRHLRADATPEAEALVEGETRGRLITEKGHRIRRTGSDVHTDQAVSIGQPPASAAPLPASSKIERKENNAPSFLWEGNVSKSAQWMTY